MIIDPSGVSAIASIAKNAFDLAQNVHEMMEVRESVDFD